MAMHQSSEELQDSSLNAETFSEVLSDRVAAVLQQCELLSPTQRTKYIVKLGHESVTDPSQKEVLSALSTGSVYERSLVVQAGWRSDDIEAAVHVLRSTHSTLLSSRTAKLIMRKGSDEQALEALRSLPQADLSAGCHYLRKCKRRSVVDTYLEALGVEGKLFKKLLPTGSRKLVQKHLPGIAKCVPNWISFVRLHPTVVYMVMCRTMSPITSYRKGDLDSTWQSIVEHMKIAEPNLADRLVDLAIESIAEMSTSALQWLSKWRPSEVADQCMKSGKFGLPDSAVSKLDIEQILELYKHNPQILSRKAIKHLSPEHRRTVWNELHKQWQDDDGVVDIGLVSLLPADLRAQEARRHLALDYFKLRTEVKMQWIQLLPWDEATLEISPFIRDGDADVRQVAIKNLIGSALYQRHHLGDVIEVVLKRRFEQDPVRKVMLSALTSLPARRWKSEHLDGLTQIVRMTLDAADLSAASISSLRQFIFNLLQYHTVWAQEQITLLIDERGLYNGLGFYGDKKYNSYLLPIMWPRMQKMREIGTGDLPKLLRYFKHNIGESNGLLSMLEDIILNPGDSGWSVTALGLVASELPERLSYLIPICLDKNSTLFIGLDLVREHLQSKLQHTLMEHLRSQEVNSKYHSNSLALQIISSETRYWRWTQKQQQILADVLVDYLHNSKYPVDILQDCIHALSLLNYVDAQHIISFANDERPPIRTVTLQRLAHLDSGEGIPVLFDSLNDDRIRFGLYALSPYILRRSPSEAFSILRTISMAKVTAAKEVLRLVGELGTEEAFQYLLSTYETDLHPDVRIALLSRLNCYLTRPEVYTLLMRALGNEDIAVLKFAAAALQNWKLDRDQPLYRDALNTCLIHKDISIRQYGLQVLHQQPPLIDTTVRFAPLLLAMVEDSRIEKRAAEKAIYNIYAATRPDLAMSVFRLYMDDMQTLSTVCEVYSNCVREGFEACTLELLDLLSEKKVTLRIRLMLMFKHCTWPEIQAAMNKLMREGDLHSDALVQAENLTSVLVNRDSIDGKLVEWTWALSQYPKLRRLGLAALVARAAGKEGWSEDIRGRLEIYRADQSALVADAAVFVFPPKKKF